MGFAARTDSSLDIATDDVGGLHLWNSIDGRESAPAAVDRLGHAQTARGQYSGNEVMGALLAAVRAHDSCILAIAFTEDGRALPRDSRDGSFAVWRVR